MTLLSTIISAFLSIVLGTTASPAFAESGTGLTVSQIMMASTPIGLWEPEVNDSFVVDTQNNIGYLIHDDGVFTAFEVVTGQRRVVHYIGRTYNATTPTRIWQSQSMHIKGDRLTYGKTGRFLRLYYEGEETPYGIHGYGREDEMFSFDSRFKSMGCIIVRENILNVIERTYQLNNGNLSVVTTYGLDALPSKVDLITKNTNES